MSSLIRGESLRWPAFHARTAMKYSLGLAFNAIMGYVGPDSAVSTLLDEEEFQEQFPLK